MVQIKLADGEYVDDELAYVNKYYSKEFKKGQKVKTFLGEGIILGGTHYVYILREGEIEHFHPQDVELLPSQTDE